MEILQKSILKNAFGFTLTEIAVTLGLAAFGGIALLSLQGQQVQNTKLITEYSNINNLMLLIHSALSDEDICSVNFSSTVPLQYSTPPVPVPSPPPAISSPIQPLQFVSANFPDSSDSTVTPTPILIQKGIYTKAPSPASSTSLRWAPNWQPSVNALISIDRSHPIAAAYTDPSGVKHGAVIGVYGGKSTGLGSTNGSTGLLEIAEFQIEYSSGSVAAPSPSPTPVLVNNKMVYGEVYAKLVIVFYKEPVQGKNENRLLNNTVTRSFLIRFIVDLGGNVVSCKA